MEFPMTIGGEEVNSLKELKVLAEDNVEAMTVLIDAYWNGDGVPQDFKKVFALCEKAVALNDTQAMIDLGFMYRKGMACEVDLLKCEELTLRAHELGDPEAKHILAEFYIYGMGPVKQDLLKGLQFAYDSIISEEGDDEIASWFGGEESFMEIYEAIKEGLVDETSLNMIAIKLRQDQPEEYRIHEPAGLYD